MRRNSTVALFGAIAFTLWTAPSSVAMAAAATGATRPALLFSLTVGREHDDNVLQLTRQNIDLFASRPGPPRFLISDVGDMTTVIEGSVRSRFRPWPRHQSELSLGAEAHRYDHDRTVDWQQYEATLAQELTASRRHLTTLELWASRIPDYYLGEITDLDESVAAGDRVRQSLDYAQLGYGVRLRRQELRGRLEFMGGIERLHRGYNQHFHERDNDNEQFRLQAVCTPFRNWGGSVRITWLKGDLNARGNIPDPLDVRDTDVSYDHDGVGVGVGLPYGHGLWRGRIDAAFMPEVRAYTTDDKFDILRFRRENHRRDTRVRWIQRVWGPLDAVVSWSRLYSRAEFHGGIPFPAEQTNFAQEQFGVSLRGRWDVNLR